ncbi:hypothetical protein Vadar_029210 [Vaccinium darrowii]|uniref:Uncharacterized protein n=1 Tax=Vaccinium darrowii TaxID=229202 RepID=A0ACB7X540_9ERIC|nr:hypothetical protein Vadar_029210 [Vaccinium darrowii]
MANLITLFVDNLADKVDPFSLRRKFTDYGIVRDVFIPNKRGKNSRKRFGFVRFDCPVSADVAIEKANGSRFLENTIIVKRAAFNKNGLVNSVKVSEFPANNKNFQNSHSPGTRRVPAQEHTFSAGDLRLSQSEHNQGAFISYANVVTGKKSLEPNRFIVKAQEEDIEWDNVIRDGEKIDDENVDSDVACLEEKTNLREHDEDSGSHCNDVSSSGESLSLSGSGGLDKQDMDGSNASNLGGDYSGRANTVLAKDPSVEVAPDVSQSIISPFSHEQLGQEYPLFSGFGDAEDYPSGDHIQTI